MSSPTKGYAAEVYVADAFQPTLAGWGHPVDVKSGIDGDATFDLKDTRGAAVLIWITDLGDDAGGTDQRSARLHLIRVGTLVALPTTATTRRWSRAARSGDRQALEDLLRRHHDRLHAVCRRLTGNDADALDATQEALIAVVRGIDRFDERSSFKTWAYRVATNAALDELRRRRRRPDPGLPVGALTSVGTDAALDDTVADPARRRRRARPPARRVPGPGGAPRPLHAVLRRDRRCARDPARHGAITHRPWPRRARRHAA